MWDAPFVDAGKKAVQKGKIEGKIDVRVDLESVGRQRKFQLYSAIY